MLCVSIKQRGNTVVVWRDGKAVWIAPEDTDVPDTDEDLEDSIEGAPADPLPVLPSKV